jgi:16S rRNA G966 N2-methylase RsmD
LLEKYELLVSLWAWLIRVSSRDIRSIPLNVETTDDVHLCQEAQWLVGFWLNRASAQPKKSKSKTFKCGWTKGVSERLAEQVEYIRHWQVFKADFESIDTEIAPEATWFIDPPYQQAGKYYRHSSKSIDYSRLASFCQQAKGQVIVCENAGADWLPFEPFGIFGAQSHNGARKSVEVIWRKRP